jgi:hypothetical protein
MEIDVLKFIFKIFVAALIVGGLIVGVLVGVGAMLIFN